MKYLLLLSFISLLFSCKNENSDKIRKDFQENNIDFSFSKNKKDNDIFNGGEEFKTKEASRMNQKGVNLVKKFDYAKAKIKFTKALEIEPNNPTILNNLGNIADLNDDLDKAITYFQESLAASDSLYINSALNLGVIYYRTKSIQKSIVLFNHVLSKSTNRNQRATAHFQLSKSYLEIGECSKARAELLSAKAVFRDVPEFNRKIKFVEGEIRNCEQQ